MANTTDVVIKSTAKRILKGAQDTTIRSNFLLSYIDSEGRNKFNDGGYSRKWTLQVHEPQVIASLGMGGISQFSSHQAYDNLELGNRGYLSWDGLHDIEKLENSDDLAIVKLYATKQENLLKAMRNELSAAIYADGGDNDSGNLQWQGLLSFLGYDSGNTVAADRICPPNSNYGGKSCVLGSAFGGSWDSVPSGETPWNASIGTNWPYGTGDAEYGAISPTIWNFSSPSWPSGGTTWTDNCVEVMGHAKDTSMALCAGEGDAPYCHILSRELMNEFKTHVRTKQRVQLTRDPVAADLGPVGRNVLHYEGDMVHTEYYVPANEGFGFNVNAMLIYYLHPNMYRQIGPDFSLEGLMDRWIVSTVSNPRFTDPRCFSRYVGAA